MGSSSGEVVSTKFAFKIVLLFLLVDPTKHRFGETGLTVPSVGPCVLQNLDTRSDKKHVAAVFPVAFYCTPDKLNRYSYACLNPLAADEEA